MAAKYEYKVVEVRERAGKMSGSKLTDLLNNFGSQGWQLKSITSADVGSAMGFGSKEGVLVTFERQT